MRVLVSGATGFIGRHLLSRLSEGGNTPLALPRGRDGAPELADIGAWAGWPDRVDAVVHLAALNPSRRDDVTEAALTRGNVAGTAALARRAAAAGVARMVVVSSANVHGADDAAIREDTPLAPQNAYARSKAAAETAFWAALEDTALKGCVLRPAPVFGGGGRGSVAALIRLARTPWPLPLGGLGGPRSLVAVDHVVDAIVLALHRPEAAGRTFLVADADALRPAEIVRALREGMGRSPGILPAPSRLIGAAAKLVGKGALWRSLNAPFVVDAAKIATELGWQRRDPVPALHALGAMLKKS